MKNKALLLGLNIFMFSLSQAGTALPGPEKKPVIAFTENKGQVHDQNYQPRPDVLYGAMTGNMAVHIKKTGVSYQLCRVDRYTEIEDPKTKVKRKEIAQQSIYRVDLNWVKANTNLVCTQDETLPGYNNYYLESCPNGALQVKSYKGVTLHNLYNGIDLHYYEKNGELKHDYIVAARTDYTQIQIKVEGAEISLNEDGSLLLTTPLGKIKEGAPIVYQNSKLLSARWKKENNILSFVVEDYNPNYELIIDPVTRLWGSYYGGNNTDRAEGCTTDVFGNVYLSGYSASNSSTLIATSGSHQSNSGGSYDAFLIKFNSNGIRLWGTYYGGSSNDYGNACHWDVGGNIYLVGSTGSSTGTVIATNLSHQPVKGGLVDAFLVKFNSNGIRQWATYYGGLNNDDGYSCATDMNGNVYIAGNTNSSNGTSIATFGSHQAVIAGSYDAFLVKFNSNGVRQWATYYGGTGLDRAFSCASDISGNVYLSGNAFTSTTGIATIGSHQAVYGGGNYDGFLVKFNTNGIRQWGTYYGDTGDDIGLYCATDASGNVHLAGFTTSNSGTTIATLGSHQATNSGGAYDAFISKFDPNGVRQWGTYYGGTGDDQGYVCHVDGNGNIYLTGSTDSGIGTMIATTGSHQSIFGGGIYDGFLAKFNSSGIRQWGTYYGGAGDDHAYSCITNNSGVLFLAGYTDSNTGMAIATPGSHQQVYGGGVYDAFLAKFDVCDVAPTQPLSISGNTTICSGSGSNSYSVAIVPGATSYTWSLPAGWSGTSSTNSISASPGSSGVFSVLAGNACGSSVPQTLSVTVNPLPAITVSTSAQILCEGESATLTASGASTYTFNPGGTGASIVVTPNVSSTYTVSGTDANGCSNTTVITQNVDACVGINSNNLITSSGVEMYPNPTEGKINLELSSNYEVTIINSLGQVVYEAKLKSGKHVLDLENLAKGVYVVRMRNGKDSGTIKLIKE